MKKVFELLLRLKANYLWPAMWGNAFYDDDSLNAVVADQYGIVIGTSHHEPMLRAHDEWRRYGKGKWNYDSNEVRLKQFWEEGLRRKRNYESIVTVGMRGDGDEPMSEQSNIALLERIVADQRKIISQRSQEKMQPPHRNYGHCIKKYRTITTGACVCPMISPYCCAMITGAIFANCPNTMHRNALAATASITILIMLADRAITNGSTPTAFHAFGNKCTWRMNMALIVSGS